MSPRRRFAYAAWTLSADNGKDVPTGVFQIECMTCEDRSERIANDAMPQQTWALDHTGRNPDHRGYKLHTETYWRVDPAAGNPLAEVSP